MQADARFWGWGCHRGVLFEANAVRYKNCHIKQQQHLPRVTANISRSVGDLVCLQLQVLMQCGQLCWRVAGGSRATLYKYAPAWSQRAALLPRVMDMGQLALVPPAKTEGRTCIISHLVRNAPFGDTMSAPLSFSSAIVHLRSRAMAAWSIA